MKPARNHYLDGSTDLTGITPDNFEGFKEYQRIHAGRNVKAIQINYPFHVRNLYGIQKGKKGDYILYTPPSPAKVNKRWFENNYQEKVQ